MSLVPWRGKRGGVDAEGSSPLGFFRSELDNLFDRFLGDPWGWMTEGGSTREGWMPSLDVTETDTEVTIRAEVAGVDPKDLEVTLTGQTLTLSGEKKEFSEKKTENCHHSERRFGSFRRSVQLPATVDTEEMNAEHKNGILEIHLKKVVSAQPRRIPVQTAKG